MTLQKPAGQAVHQRNDFFAVQPIKSTTLLEADPPEKLKLETSKVAKLPKSMTLPSTICKTSTECWHLFCPWAYYCSCDDVAFCLICVLLTVLLPLLNVTFHFLEEELPGVCPFGKIKEASWQIKMRNAGFPSLFSTF